MKIPNVIEAVEIALYFGIADTDECEPSRNRVVQATISSFQIPLEMCVLNKERNKANVCFNLILSIRKKMDE